MVGLSFTALESSFQQVDFVRRYGGKVYYGDASRVDLLNAARAGEAKLLVLAIDDVDASVKTAQVVRRHFPDLPIIARARNRTHYFQLRNLGIRNIFRETFPASVDMARLALLMLGMAPAATERTIALFRRHDEERLDAQYAVRQDEARLIQSTREAADQLRELFETDIGPAAFARRSTGERAT
jgi:glutathione-regulated potassium-efflux system protein KefB